jgi:hypothetical protein
VVNVDFGIGNSQKDFEFGDRVSRIVDNKISYDKNGRQIGRHNLTFVYDDFSQLVEVKSHENIVLSTFRYDGDGRVVVQIVGRTSEVLNFFYARQDQPNLVTHIHSSKRGLKKLQVTKLTNKIAQHVLTSDKFNLLVIFVLGCHHIMITINEIVLFRNRARNEPFWSQDS